MNHLLRAIFLLALLCPALAAAEDNTIYNELLDQGVALANGKMMKLPPPVMVDGLKQDAQDAKLKQVGPKDSRLYKQFTNGDPNDWYEIKQPTEKGSSPDDSIGRGVDLYFVAKGKLQTVANPNFIKEQMQQTKQKKIDFLSDDELKARKLTVKDSNNLKERYAHALLTPDDLFGKVQVGGIGHGIETLNPESILIAFKLDPRFDKDKDKDHPNQYQTAKTDADGKIVLDPAKPYNRFGGYAKLTKLQGPGDRIFVEYHLVFDEPHDWFNGTTELASKLDTSYKANIRKFRRDLNPPPPDTSDDKSAPAAAADKSAPATAKSQAKAGQ